ncbi:MAG: hypothetical protein KDE54_39055 [Caldilineaceae bacterium]|nr:hypothetical protein [Caldilineaceae bacterium]MCB0139568.1 hypothetical protein [Caldilineaceae bacterium]
MGQSEFNDWMAFYKLEPFGEIREEMRNGLLVSTLANAHRDRKKQREPYSTTQFMFPYESPTGSHEQKMSLKDKFKMVAAYHNARLEAEQWQSSAN